MKLIQSNVELLQQEPGIEGMYRMIDKVAGICYNRHELHEDSKAFVDSLIEKGHLRPLEFGTVYLKIEYDLYTTTEDEFKDVSEIEDFAVTDKYTVYNRIIDSRIFNGKRRITIKYYITTNYRVLVENNRIYFLEHWCEPTEHHFKRPCVHYNLSRGILDEFRTHITLSHMAKSTRYCNESKKEMEFVKPYWYDDVFILEARDIYEFHLGSCEYYYKYLIEKKNLKPQEARGILPLDLATELCSCGFVGIDNTGWNRFFDMRCDKSAHPDAEKLADETKQLFIENGYI